MNIYKLFTVVLIMMCSSILSANAHDSHTHKAPWKACEVKTKMDQCSYTNGEGDLFKGTCQLFSKVLMCVRNQPIIHVKELAKKSKKNKE
jgi:hypothetical protein